MIYLLELEPLKERYTYWWTEYIPAEMRKRNKVEVISGEALTDRVETGLFLDAGSTNHWKANQLQKVAKLFFDKQIKPGDIFFVCDLWYPGIEMIPYMASLYNIPVYIYGIWHCGSCNVGDVVTKFHEWSRFFEMGFFKICDGVFVGSEHSKQEIVESLLYGLHPEEQQEISKKIHPFGMPIDWSGINQYSAPKEKIILFPHRPDPEKNPLMFINLIEHFYITWPEWGDYKWIFCTSKKEFKAQDPIVNSKLKDISNRFDNVIILEDLSKDEFYKLLGRTSLVVSTNYNETFGYSIVEAITVGANVLVPNKFSYPEILDHNQDFMYDNIAEFIEKLPILASRKIEINPKITKNYVWTVNSWVTTMHNNSSMPVSYRRT